MRFLYDNLRAIFIALVVSVVAWVYGGTMSAPLLRVVPWLMLFLLEVLFFFPQRHSSETTYDARERLWERMRKDPLVWTVFGFILLLSVPFVNNGLCPSCDAPLVAQGISPKPPISFLPFCVNRLEHLNVFLWFLTAFLCMVATRHGLVNSGKRILLELIVWNGAALAAWGFIQVVAGAPGPFWETLPNGARAQSFFSTWGYANMAGDFFTTIFGVSVALWRWHYDETEKELAGKDTKPRDFFWRKNYYLLPAGLSFFAALNTLSRSAMMMATVLLVIYFLHTFWSFSARISKARRVKALALWGGIVGFLVFLAVSYMPDEMKKEVGTINTTSVLQRVTGKNEDGVRIANEIWHDHPLFGCGGWGYRHFANTKMDPAVVDKLNRESGLGGNGRANVHNDYMQFLAEHGLVGLAAFVAVILMLLWPIYQTWQVLVKTARFSKKKDRPPSPIQIFVLPAPVFCILSTIVATSVHAFADCPFRSPAILSLYFVLLAAADGFMPEVEPSRHESSHHRSSHHS